MYWRVPYTQTMQSGRYLNKMKPKVFIMGYLLANFEANLVWVFMLEYW